MVTLQMGQPLAFLLGAACTLLGLPYISGAVVATPELARLAVAASSLGILGTLGFLGAGVSPETSARAVREIIGTLFLTTGLLLVNARAGIEALLGRRSEFVRTPKPRAEPSTPRPRSSALGHYGMM
jgi:hypothetical protein